MTVLSTFSYGLIGFGPMIVLFCVTVMRKPHEVIIMMSAAFFWVLSLLLTSLIWLIVPPLQNTPAFHLPFAVLLQELMRWLLYRLLRRADKVLEVISDDKSPRRKHRIAYVSGLGFGTISAVVQFANILRDSGGPAVVGVNNMGHQYVVLSSAFGTNAVLMLHICWSVLWFSGWNTLHTNGYRKPSSILGWLKICTVLITHMLVACLSLLNNGHSSLYFLVVAYVCLALLSAYALVTAGALPSNMKHFFKL